MATSFTRPLDTWLISVELRGESYVYKKHGLLNSLGLVFAKKLLECMKQCYVVL